MSKFRLVRAPDRFILSTRALGVTQCQPRISYKILETKYAGNVIANSQNATTSTFPLDISLFLIKSGTKGSLDFFF